MWLSDYDKIPGLDGFPLGFLKMYWDFVKDDVVNIIQALPFAVLPIHFISI